MLLTINERLAIIAILHSQEGRIAFLKTLRKAREELEIDEEDHAAADMRQDWTCPKCRYMDYYLMRDVAPACPLCATMMHPGQQLRWDPRAPARDIQLSETAVSVVAGYLTRQEADGKLRDNMLDLYDKFVDG